MPRKEDGWIGCSTGVSRSCCGFSRPARSFDAFFAFFTFLGDEEFYLLALPLIYWSINRAVGVRLMVVFLLSGLVNQVAKHLAAQPRPFQYDSRVKEIVGAEGFGLPSGHTQSAVVVWGYLGTTVRKRWFWVLAGTLMVLTPLSRIYLGVHFPTDVLGGYVLGAAGFVAVAAVRHPVGGVVLQLRKLFIS